MSDEKSYRQILRSTSIIGGASVLNVVIGLVRIKVAAILLGPSGVGLIGLFNSLISTASSVAALGIGTVGTRQIAEAAGRHDDKAVAVARLALLWATLALASIGSLIFWLLRGILSTYVLADGGLSSDLGWLALGIGLTVIAASQSALLNGLRRISDLARISVYSAFLSTVLGSGALFLWQQKGLLVFLLLVPLSKFAFGCIYVTRLPKIRTPHTALSELGRQWGTLARLGFSFMLAGLAATASQLVVRTLVQQELGTDALGYFEAAWVISMTYIGFVLSAMGTDYYPRLTAVIQDHEAVNRLVNQQTEVALLLASPVFLAMLGLAPWVIELLYSARFGDAAIVLRWQILGDILKLASWPLGFVILAAGDGRVFMFAEILVMSIFALIVWVGLPYLGLQVTGVGFLIMYIVYLPLVYWLARRRTGFRWTSRVRLQMVLVVGASALLLIFAHWSSSLAAIFGMTTSALFAIHALVRLGGMSNSSAQTGVWVRKLIARFHSSRRR